MNDFIIERECTPQALAPLVEAIADAREAGVDPEIIAAACVGLNLKIGLDTGIEALSEMPDQDVQTGTLVFLRDKCAELLPNVYEQVGLS